MTHSVLYAVIDPDVEERKAFIPIPDAKAHLAYQGRVDDILLEITGSTISPIDAETILSEYVAVLCILIEIEKGAAISEFVRRGWNDHQLPCGPNVDDLGFPFRDGDLHQKFCHVQMKFCVPDFSRNMHGDFDETRILPISRKRKISDHGGGATLYEVRVHGIYNKLHTDVGDSLLKDTFALRTYSIAKVQFYDSKLHALRKLQQIRDKHLIGVYGSYTQGNSYNVLLEWADRGSLEHYFQLTNPPAGIVGITNFWTSLFGTLRALHTIHQFEAGFDAKWHQDVNPNTILAVSNGAASPYQVQFKLRDLQFRLRDLHLAHLRGFVDNESSSTAQDVFEAQTYAAPECFLDNNFWVESPCRAKQDADVWSCGYVLSEAAVWIVKGYDSILRYRKSRRAAAECLSGHLGDSFHDGKSTLPVVWTWHDELMSSVLAADRITPAVLTMIEEHMLTKSIDRLDSGQLMIRAERMLKELQALEIPIRPPSPQPTWFRQSAHPAMPMSYRQEQLFSNRGTLQMRMASNMPAMVCDTQTKALRFYLRTALKSPAPFRCLIKDVTSPKKQNNKLLNRFRKREEMKLPGEHLFGRLGKRDHVFIIDDADSMIPHWDEMCELFAILAYVVKASDEDGIEVYFTMDNQIYKNKNVTALANTVRNRKEDLDGSSNINMCLGMILTNYKQELRREHHRRRFTASSAFAEDKKPLTTLKADPTREIKDIVESLVELRCQPSQNCLCGISPWGSKTDYISDLVDHTRSSGNLWKMVLGAIDEERDPVDEPNEPGAE
ncbi:uncharacterized protein PAC_04284 [Phialocephala subalpina]|uniref:Protein kinase domain-containing protein n=1 Tax=Phialocephala subalpina TaxID=576137 RepID=A0A1L7WNQ4_9HELO|nr:uncharacterized protein PAC_04284 [Phialocephala subalpina]